MIIPVLCHRHGNQTKSKGNFLHGNKKHNIQTVHIYQTIIVGALLKNQDDDVTVSKIELHTTTDCDTDRISIQLAEKTSKSVGLIMGYLTYGTGFRVGEKYVMTSLHFVKDVCSKIIYHPDKTY